MAPKQTHLCEQLKLLGYTQGDQVRLYGLQFELRGDPLVMADNVVLIDAIDRKSGETRRVRIPLTILNWQVQTLGLLHDTAVEVAKLATSKAFREAR